MSRKNFPPINKKSSPNWIMISCLILVTCKGIYPVRIMFLPCIFLQSHQLNSGATRTNLRWGHTWWGSIYPVCHVMRRSTWQSWGCTHWWRQTGRLTLVRHKLNFHIVCLQIKSYLPYILNANIYNIDERFRHCTIYYLSGVKVQNSLKPMKTYFSGILAFGSTKFTGDSGDIMRW